MKREPIDKKEYENSNNLAKKLGTFDYFSIGFGSIIGVGWVIVMGDWINIGGGPVAAITAFTIGALMLIPIAFVHAELAVDIPVAGGAIAFTQKAFGSLTSYFTGWFLTLGYIMMCPWEAVAISHISEALFPVLRTYPLYSIGEYTIYAPSLIISLMVSIVIIAANYKGIEHVAKIQNILTVGLLLISAISIIISASKGSLNNILPIVASTPKNPGGSLLKGVFSVLALTPFFYSGFDTIPQEVEECSQDISLEKFSRTIIFSIFAACLFYILVITAISVIMPWKSILGLNIPSAQVYDVGLKLPFMSKLILIGALCGLITTLNSFFVSGARALLALGRAKLINGAFSKVHPNYKTPYFSNAIIAIITLLGPFIGKKILLPIVNVCSFGFMAAWLLVCLSSIKLGGRQHNIISNKKSLTVFLRYSSVILSVLMILILILPSSPGALQWPLEWGIIGVWSLLGIILYLFQLPSSKYISNEERCRMMLGKHYDT